MEIKFNGTCTLTGLPANVQIDYLKIPPTFDEPQQKYQKGLRESCNINPNCHQECLIVENAPQIIEA